MQNCAIFEHACNFLSAPSLTGFRYCISKNDMVLVMIGTVMVYMEVKIYEKSKKSTSS